MKVFIFGHKGNMGRRYTAILKHLDVEVSGVDVGEYAHSYQSYAESDAVIIATPTSEHIYNLRTLLGEKKKVLCEKPITTDINQLSEFIDVAAKAEMKLSMVSQYDYLDDKISEWEGNTCYNYFKTGNDGIAWDCINIIWHAKGKIKLKNESPIWSCVINARPQRIEMMDFAYVRMIEDWLETPYKPQYDRILKSHEKVLDYLNGKFD